MQTIHPLSVPANFGKFRKAACRPRSGRKFRRRRKARRRCRLSKEKREEFIKQFWHRALAFVDRRGVRDAQSVVDAAMNETLRVYRKRKGKFGPLLFIILRWRCISAYRDQMRNKIITVPLVEGQDMPIAGECACDEQSRDWIIPVPHDEAMDVAVETASPITDDEELHSAIREAWAGLEPVERRLLHLHTFKGLTFPQIRKLKYFRARGWKVTTLRAKAHRARLKLRKQLRPFREGTAQASPLPLSALSWIEPSPRATQTPQTADAS